MVLDKGTKFVKLIKCFIFIVLKRCPTGRLRAGTGSDLKKIRKKKPSVSRQNLVKNC